MVDFSLHNVISQAWPLKTVSRRSGCPKTSVNNYQHALGYCTTQKSEDLTYTAEEARNLADPWTSRLWELQISQSEMNYFAALWGRWSNHHCFFTTLWIMNVWVGPVYWKLQLAGQTTREQAVGGGPNPATQGGTSVSRNLPQTGHRTTDEEQLYLRHTQRLFCVSWLGTADYNAVECDLRSSVGLWNVPRFLQSEEFTANDYRTVRTL
jgi:hypothetical protein